MGGDIESDRYMWLVLVVVAVCMWGGCGPLKKDERECAQVA